MVEPPAGEPPAPSRIVGILGGMGPAATVDFYDKLVRATPATRDQDHLRVAMWADPTVPDRTRALLDGGEDPTPWLQRGAAHLVDCGAEILVVPCNTIHTYMPAVIKRHDIEFISIVDASVEATKQIAAEGKIGLLATGALIDSGLYQDALRAEGLEPVLPSETAQDALMQIIYRVKAGDTGRIARARASGILEELRTRGATAVIAACTEMSVLLTHLDPGIRIIDPSWALAVKTVERALRIPAAIGKENR